MAYNNLSGTVFLPRRLVANDDSGLDFYVSGTLAGDGTEISNVPRVTNATDNALVTNLYGDANSLHCESNLTFDGTILNVVGNITASTGISASYYEGDGSRLTGISADSINADGPLYSVQFHDPIDSSFTGSANLLLKNEVLVAKTGLVHNHRTITTSITASLNDYYIGIDSSAAPVQISLLSAASLYAGQTIIMKDEAGTSSTNNVTIVASGSQTIDGQNSVVLESTHASIQLYCNGLDKYHIC